MYGKMMSISDEMMWSYYELLTDVAGEIEIEKMKRESASDGGEEGSGAEDRGRLSFGGGGGEGGEDWAKQFQKDRSAGRSGMY